MGPVNEKSTARAGSVARDRLVRALLQSAFQQGPQPLSLAQAAQLADLSRPAVVASKDQLREVLAPGDGVSQTIALEPALGAAIGVEIRQDEVTVLLSDLAGQPLVEPK